MKLVKLVSWHSKLLNLVAWQNEIGNVSGVAECDW